MFEAGGATTALWGGSAAREVVVLGGGGAWGPGAQVALQGAGKWMGEN